MDLRAEDLDEHKPYREPRRLEIRNVRGNIGVRKVTVDPEDDEPNDTLQLGVDEADVTMI